MDNAGVWGGTDQGDGLTSINPDDIESITVLKGANAAALYGSRGGYGVINITTKKGTARKGIGIEFNSNYVFEKVINYLDLQEQYGQGSLLILFRLILLHQGLVQNLQPRLRHLTGVSLHGVPSLMDPTILCGMALQDLIHLHGVQKNFDEFFQTGSSWTNTLSLTGGSDKQTFRFSFSDLRSDGVIPESGFNRKNVSLSTNGKFGKKITFRCKSDVFQRRGQKQTNGI